MRFISQQHRTPIILGILVVLMVLVIKTSDHPFLDSIEQRLEWLAYDMRLRSTLPDQQEIDPRIVLIDIDEKSLAAEGRWPWPRDKVARMVDILFEQGAAVIGFDIVFAEHERNVAEQVVKAVQEQNLDVSPDVISSINSIAPTVDHDAILAQSLAGKPVVLGYFFSNSEENSKGDPPPHLVELDPVQAKRLLVPEMKSYTANISQLQENAASVGAFTVEPDDDGVVRRAPLIIRYKNNLYPSLALEVARLFLNTGGIDLRVEDVGDSVAIEAIMLGNYFSMPTDLKGRAVIPYRGEQGSYKYISATDVLNKKLENNSFTDMIVLVGTTAEGHYDLRSTPVQSVFPGIEIHANIISGILDNALPHAPAWAEGLDLTLIILFGVLLAILFPLLNGPAIIVSTFVLIAAMIFANTWLWVESGLVLSIAIPVLMVFLLSSVNLAYGYIFESQGRKQLKTMFGQYVPPDLVEEMYDHPESDFGFEGESREMTVLFADIRNFTSISEILPANELKKMLNHFFTPMTQIIFDSRGTIDKYVGDMIMAFWGAPLPDTDHRTHAIGAALEMLDAVESMKPVIQDKGWPEISIGIGLNSGMMNVGDMGSEFRRSYTVIGDAVNLGSRLEGLTKYYGVGLIVSEYTRENCDDFVFRKLDLVRVKGKNEAVAIYEPICRSNDCSEDSRNELSIYQSALDAYYVREWDKAHNLLKDLLSQYHERKIYQIYLDRITSLRTMKPGDDWDGVHIHTQK